MSARRAGRPARRQATLRSTSGCTRATNPTRAMHVARPTRRPAPSRGTFACTQEVRKQHRARRVPIAVFVFTLLHKGSGPHCGPDIFLKKGKKYSRISYRLITKPPSQTRERWCIHQTERGVLNNFKRIGYNANNSDQTS